MGYEFNGFCDGWFNDFEGAFMMAWGDCMHAHSNFCFRLAFSVHFSYTIRYDTIPFGLVYHIQLLY